MKPKGDKKFGELVRATRHEQGLTLEDLANKAGLSKNYLSQVEKGDRWCCVAIRTAITTALDLPSHLATLHPEPVLQILRECMEQENEYVMGFRDLGQAIQANRITPDKLKALIAINR